MKRGIAAILWLAETIVKLFGQIGSWLNPLLVLLIMVDVTARYLFQETSVWVNELEWNLYAAMFLLAGGYTLQSDQHVRVDVLYQRWSPRTQALINLLGHTVLLIPICLFLIPPAWDFFMRSWLLREGSGDPSGLAALYPIKAMMPLAFVLLLIQASAEAVKSLLTLFSPLTPSR